MRIGIIGAGNIGGTLARLWSQAGHDVRLSWTRTPERLEQLARDLGPSATAGTPGQAAAYGEVVVLSVPWPQVGDAVTAAGDLTGRVLVDTTNPFTSPGGPLALDLSTTSAAAVVAGLAPGARTVKAFNTLYWVTLAERAHAPQPLAVPVSGDDEAATRTVATLVTDAGFEPVLLGGLDQAGQQEPAGPLYGEELTADQVRDRLTREPRA